nr:MAG TPA: lytic transglycosylase [Caudoviricetes sp.]
MVFSSRVDAPACEILSADCSKDFTAQPTAQVAETNLIEWQTFVITAYCHCEKCCGKSDGVTATGREAKQGHTVAVDPSVIPYGSIIYIDDVGDYIAEDCGGKIKGNRIDIYFDSHKDALEFGKQEHKVYIERRDY